jgi:hypothetical protein
VENCEGKDNATEDVTGKMGGAEGVRQGKRRWPDTEEKKRMRKEKNRRDYGTRFSSLVFFFIKSPPPDPLIYNLNNFENGFLSWG